MQESINYVRPEFYTGAEALADWVSTGSCPLKYLDVSWNTIRLDSAVYFGNAVACETLRTWFGYHCRNDMKSLVEVNRQVLTPDPVFWHRTRTYLGSGS